MNKQILKSHNLIESVIIFLLIIISCYVTNEILIRNVSLVENNNRIIEKEIYTPLNIYINNVKHTGKEKINKEKKTNKEKGVGIEHSIITKKDFYKFTIDKKDFLLSNDPNGYNFGFITKQLKNNILYLYSHNSYKMTENSGYFLYKRLKLNDIITFNDSFKYKISKTSMIDLSNKDYNNLLLDKSIDIIYFTCTPYGDNIRKVYMLTKIKDNKQTN